MREVVSVQVGDFANYIGSHFWNFQDEILGEDDPIFSSAMDMDVLYRQGQTHSGNPTYTPRLLSIAHQGSLGSLSSTSFYDDDTSSDPSSVLTWKGRVSRQVAEPHRRNLFQESLYGEQPADPTATGNGETLSAQAEMLDRDLVDNLEIDVHFWTDFSKVQYHPRSLYELCCSWTDPREFNDYGSGTNVFSDGLLAEEIIDRLRFFVEECDHIQGIQYIVDDSGGFSSVASDFLENIVDEYGKTPVLLYSARDPKSLTNSISNKQSVSRALHDAVSFSRLSSLSKLIVPVGLPSFTTSKLFASLNINDAKLFHSSSVYAAAIHSITLPFRMKPLGPTAYSEYASNPMDIGDLVQILAGQGRQNIVQVLDVAMPAPSIKEKQSQGCFQRNLHPLTPEVAEDAEDMHAVESVVVHGVVNAEGRRASIAEVEDAFFSGYRDEFPKPRFSHLSSALCPLPVPLPFPSIFRSSVGQGVQSVGPLEISSIPMIARLRSSNAILPLLEKLLANLGRFGMQRGAVGIPLLRDWGFAKEEIDEMGEGLSKMVKAFNPHPELSSDSD